MAQARQALPADRIFNENSAPGARALARPLAVAPTATEGAGLNSSLMAESATARDGSLVLSFSRAPSPGLRLVDHQEDQFEWVRQFQMVSLADRNRVALPRFEGKPQTLRPDVRAIRLGTPAEPAEEVAAFRFLK
jgi:hypothetical protein